MLNVTAEQETKIIIESQRWHEMQEQFKKDSARSIFRKAWDALVDSSRRPLKN